MIVRRAAAITAIVTAAWAPQAHAALDPNPVVDNSTRAGAYQAYHGIHEKAVAVAAGWTGAVSTCAAGTISADAHAAALTTVNYYRSMLGLSPARLDTGYDKQAQAAALMMQAAQKLDHNPDSSWKCYTADGKAGAGSSNLALGWGTPGAAVAGYMDDSDVDSLGHRRWVMNPTTTVMGIGHAVNANALKVFGTLGAASGTAPEHISWPDKDYVPAQLVPDGTTWSYSTGDPTVDLRAASVTVTKDGVNLPVTTNHLQQGFGPDTISFTPRTGYTGGSDQTFVVTVSGRTRAGSPLPSYTYRTTLFDATLATNPKLTPRPARRTLIRPALRSQAVVR